MSQMSTILLKVDQQVDSQWDQIPEEVKKLYMNSIEPLYSTGIGGEDIRQKEANIYNAIFGQYGLSKPIHN